MKRTPEQLAEWCKRLASNETMEEIGASETPPITRQRVAAILAFKPKERKVARVPLMLSLPPEMYAWVLREVKRTGLKKSQVVQMAVAAAMEA